MERSVRINTELSIPLGELDFRSARSGGPGGQNVNKVETKVELLFDVTNARSLTASQRAVLQQSLASRISSDGFLKISVQESRSQYQNKQIAIEKFVALLVNALRPRKTRRSTKPTRGAKERRLDSKRKRSEIKRSRSAAPDN